MRLVYAVIVPIMRLMHAVGVPIMRLVYAVGVPILRLLSAVVGESMEVGEVSGSVTAEVGSGPTHPAKGNGLHYAI